MASALPAMSTPAAQLAALLPGQRLDALRGQRLFITGGTGFVGFWLLTAIGVLNEQGWNMRVQALTRDAHAFRRRHPQLAGAPWLSLLQGAIDSYATPREPCDLMIHAAIDTAQTTAGQALPLLQGIVRGAEQVLEHAASAGAARVLLVSSGAVYGALPAQMAAVAEDAPCAPDPCNPHFALGEGKRMMEMLGNCHAQQSGFACMSARCFAFAGYALPEHFALSAFVRAALHEDAIRVGGDGTALRSYLYAADLAVWLLAVLARGQGGRAYNVGSDAAISIGALAERVRALLAPAKPVHILGSPDGSLRNCYVPDIGRARIELGLDVWTGLDESILRMAGMAGMATMAAMAESPK